MIRREKLRAIILSRRNIGEADRLVTLFTRRYGVLKVVAKGVRRIPSRRGGNLEPLTQVLCILSGNLSGGQAGRSRSYLAAVEPISLYESLHRDPTAMEGALVLGRAIVSLCEEGEAYESIFDALHQALDMLPTASAPERTVLESALLLHILERTGFQPQLASCQVCGEQRPSEAVILDGQAGGWRCLVCHDSFVGTDASLPPRLLKATRWLADNPQRALRLKMEALEGEQLLLGLRRYIAQVIGTSVTASLVPVYAQ
jgi:DNA repair protein RecO (recombination protein O)